MLCFFGVSRWKLCVSSSYDLKSGIVRFLALKIINFVCHYFRKNLNLQKRWRRVMGYKSSMHPHSGSFIYKRLMEKSRWLVLICLRRILDIRYEPQRFGSRVSVKVASINLNSWAKSLGFLSYIQLILLCFLFLCFWCVFSISIFWIFWYCSWYRYSLTQYSIV